MRRILIGLTMLLALLPAAAWADGTLMGVPKFTGFDDNGHPVVYGKLCAYIAGTSSAQATYSDVGLQTPNHNPALLDAAGRATVFLSPGASYKFILMTAGTDQTCTTGTTVWSQDNVSSIPGAAATLDIVGTAGETITAGQVVYLSAGDGSKAGGQWYKADASLYYSSATPTIGIATGNITAASTGAIRLGGQVAGLTSLVPGLDYYVGTAGALTLTTTLHARRVGRADSTSTLVIDNRTTISAAWANDFRLTLTSATPVTCAADVTAATTIYYTPFNGNRLDLPDATGAPTRFIGSEISIAVPASTNQVYDIFGYDNAGVPTLELLAWTNDTTRQTATIRTTTGRWYKTGDLTRLYLGSFRTTAVSGQTESSVAKRYLFNEYNRVKCPLQRYDSTASWPYALTAVRQAHADAANQVDIVVGQPEGALDLSLTISAANTSSQQFGIGIGEDSTTTYTIGTESLSALAIPLTQRLVKIPPVGRHTYTWLESGNPTGTTTFYGTSTIATPGVKGGLLGSFEN